MTTVAEAMQITVREPQLRMSEAEVAAALGRIDGLSADRARTRLRFGPGVTAERLARLLDSALIRAENNGLSADSLVIADARTTVAEDIVRVRRKAHGVADFISSPTTDVTLVLRPLGMVGQPAVDDDPAAMIEPAAPAPVAVDRVESAEEAAIREALYEVIDPDLGVNVVDLGFIRSIRIDDAGSAAITMTLTSAACPLTSIMEGQIATALAPRPFTVEWEWLPTWKPSDISPDGREQLQAIGFTAF